MIFLSNKMFRRFLASLMSTLLLVAYEAPTFAAERAPVAVPHVKNGTAIATAPTENVDAALAAKKAKLKDLTKPQIRQLSFSQNATDEELKSSRVFSEPLYPTSGKTLVGENQALASALLAYKAKANAEDWLDLTQFLSKFPTSRWSPALKMNLAQVCFEAGHFGDALKYWSQAWESTKLEKQPPLRAIANHSISKLMQLESRLGRTDSLAKHFSEIKPRSFAGSDQQRITDSKDGLWTQRHHSEIAYKCGPYALLVLSNLKTPSSKKEACVTPVRDMPSSSKGTSLAQLQTWAPKLGLQMQMAKRAPGAAVIVPSIMHFSVGHFAAITRELGGRYYLEDRTFDSDFSRSVSKRTVDTEADGYFLVPKGKLPSGWTAANSKEAQQVWGRGVTTGRAPGLTKQTPMGGLPPNSCKRVGMAKASYFSLSTTLNIEDYPVGYSGPIGPSMMVGLNYNYNEGNQPTTFGFTNFGANWSSNFVSYLDLSGSSILVSVRGGGYENYTPVNTYYPPDPYSQAQIVVLGGGSYQRLLPDGTVENFTLSDGTRTYMTSIVDPQGNSAVMGYDTNFRLITVTDASGNPPTTFSYVSNTVGNAGFYKASSITDAAGRTASFTYDSATTPTFLTSITDSVGNVSQFQYDTSTGFINMMTTPYGSTQFYQYTPLGIFKLPPVGLRAVFADGSSAVVENWDATLNTTFYWDREATELYPSDPPNHVYTHCTSTRFLVENSLEMPVISWTRRALEAPVNYYYAGSTDQVGFAGTSNKPIQISRQVVPFTQTLTVGGTIHAGDVITLSIGDGAIPEQPNVSYTVLSGDTLSSVASSLANLLSSSPWYQSIGITSTAVGAVITITSLSINYAAVNVGLSGGATETITQSGQINPPQSSTLNGYPTAGDVISITVTNSALSGGHETVSYTAKTTDYFLNDVAQRLVSALNNDANLRTIGFYATWTSNRFTRLGNMYNNQVVLNYVTAPGTTYSSTDPQGNVTSWQHDLEGRQIKKVYPDNSNVTYSYETDNSRLSSMTDALSQTTSFVYGLDDRLVQKNYSGAVNPTSNVSYIFDWTFPRSTNVTNGWGTNTYTFNPYNMVLLTGTPTTGDYVNVIFYNFSFANYEHDLQYQVQASDTTLTALATHVASAINGDSTLTGAGISATSSSGTVTVAGGTHVTSSSANAGGVTTLSLSGTPTVNDRISITAVNDIYNPPNAYTVNYTIGSGDTLTTVATNLVSLFNNQYSAIGLTATSVGSVITVTAASHYPTSYVLQVPNGSTEVFTQGGGATEGARMTVPNNLGNSRLASASNSVIANSTVTYSFDALGRSTNRSINGASNSTTWSYDAISRITSEVNPLGTFGYTYVDQTPTDKGVTRLSSISYPNGQTTNFSWLPNIGDQRLQQIVNLNPSSSIISQFNQAYDSAAEITQWQQQQNSTNTHLGLGYDAASQLTAANSDSGSLFKAYISGTPHTGDVISVTAYDASLTGTTPKGQETASYTVTGADTSSTIATNLATNIGTAMSNISVTATASGSVISIKTSSSYCTQFICAATGSGVTDTIALSGSSSIANLHKQLYCHYDCAGNRIGVQGDSSGSFPAGLTTTSTQYLYNDLNELTGIAAGGPITFQASTVNPITAAAANVAQTATITDTSITVNDSLWLIVHDKGLGKPETINHLVVGTDTPTSIASDFAAKINADSSLSNLGELRLPRQQES